MAKKENKKRECCKGFFKPTIVKIVTFIIIAIILLILIKPNIGCANCVSCPCYLGFIGLDNHIIPGITVTLDTSYNSENKANLIIYLIYLIEIIISYLLSCLIILIYNKFNNKK